MQKITSITVSALIIAALAEGCTSRHAGESDIYSSKADSIIKIMTLDEKIGQLTLFTSDLSTTGPTMRSDYIDLIRQ